MLKDCREAARPQRPLSFWKNIQIKNALEGKKYHILYLKADDINSNLDVIRKERTDENGNEMWFPIMMGYFNDSPYAKAKGLNGEKSLIDHFRHRQELELRICEEIFTGNFTVVRSKSGDIPI